MPVALDYYEIIDADKNRYLYYYCETHQENHLICVDNKTMTRIRTAAANADEVLLWCGEGERPEPRRQFGLTQVIRPKVHLSRKKEQELEKFVALFERQVESVKTEFHRRISMMKGEAMQKIEQMEIGGIGDTEKQGFSQ